MALVLKDRVVESSSSTGTGTILLSGAEQGYQAFGLTNGDTTYYTIQGKQPDGSLSGEWEVGIGTYNSSTLSRDVVLSSSNGGSLVVFSSGSKDVFIDLPSEKAVYLDANNVTNALGGAQLDTAATTAIGLGKLRWNQTTATAAFGIVDGTDEVNIGEQMFAYVTNAESVAITRGQAVYLYQAQGNRATVKLAYNTSDATSAKTLGLVAQDSIAANGTGFVITQGQLSKVNTRSYAEGATLYLGATAGTLTTTKPVAPNHLVYIGVVERSNAGNGQIYVRPQNGYELDEIHDVLIVNPTTGQSLVYDGSTSLWKNSNANVINGGTIDNTPIGATTPSTGKFTSVTTPSVTASVDNLAINSVGTGTITFSSGNGIAFRVLDNGTTGNSWASYGSTVSPVLEASGSATNVNGILRTKGTGILAFRTNTIDEQLRVSHTASAVNYVQVTGAATSNKPTISAQGSDTNIDLSLTTKGTGAINLSTGNGIGFKVYDASGGTAQVNYWQARGRGTGAGPYLLVGGADTNITGNISSAGTGSIAFQTNGGAQQQFAVSHTASAVNYVQVTGAATTGRPIISAQGSDTNIALGYDSKGTGAHIFRTSGVIQFQVLNATSAVNYGTITGGATGVAPAFSVAGTDTNIDLALTPKGTGRVQFGTYTATVSTITGYIEIKDAGGTIRRLAVVS